MTIKFTPGPWSVITEIRGTMDPDLTVSSPRSGAPKGGVAYLARIREAQGNAVLIANAPGMHSLLCRMIGAFEAGDLTLRAPNATGLIAAARTLVAGIKGES
jgi:hypothetical protein